MPVLILLLILLVFPLLELWLLATLAYHYGWWLLLYLVLVGAVGWQLIKDEQMLLPLRMLSSLRNAGRQSHPLFLILVGFKNLIAGLLLMIPGVLSDAIALVILFWPHTESKAANDADFLDPVEPRAWSDEKTQNGNRQAADAEAQAHQHTVIEGEFRREDAQ